MSPAAPEAPAQALVAYLNAQRRHVLGILDGLDDGALRRPVLPSGWSCVGLVQHLAVDVERFWFRGVVAAEQDVIADFASSPDDGWVVPPERAVQTVLDGYRDEIERANTIVASRQLTDAPAWWPGDLFGDFRLDSLGEVLLHVIVETACHAGHLDAAREILDGRLWLVVTE